jgi:hypothetical protein
MPGSCQRDGNQFLSLFQTHKIYITTYWTFNPLYSNIGKKMRQISMDKEAIKKVNYPFLRGKDSF